MNLGVFHEDVFEGMPLIHAYEYHCKHYNRTRIGQIIPSKLSPLQAIPFIGWLFGTPDRWWKFSEDEQLTRENITQVMVYINRYGFP